MSEPGPSDQHAGTTDGSPEKPADQARRLRPRVRDGLLAHGIAPGAEETADQLRERLNDRYVEDVRRLKSRQIAGEIPLREYARQVQDLKDRYPLLGLPLPLWSE